MELIMKKKEFGAAGEKVVIEEFLTGPEVSVLAFTDGKTVVRPREYKETYRWDPAGRQYRPEGRHFEGLDKFNTDSL